MPTTTIAPVTSETFKPYAKLGKSNGKIQARICDLLLRLVQTDNPKKVKALCESEIEWLEAENYKPATRASYVAAYRKALSAWFTEHPGSESVTTTRQTSKGAIGSALLTRFFTCGPC